MSDYDETGLDDEDLARLYDESTDAPTPEDIFSIVLLNKEKKKKIWVELQDSDGDVIELADMLEELIKYVKDKLTSSESNQINDQIMPLMSQSLVSGLSRLIGIEPTAFFISNPGARISIIYMMVVSFVLYKMVQVKGLTIHTVEEDVSDEEIEEIERRSKASSIANMSAFMGMDPREILQKLVDRGDITQRDLEELMGQSPSPGDDDDHEANN